MNKLNFPHVTNNTPPQQKLLPLLQYLKSAYLLWHEYHQVLAKAERFSLGLRIDTLFIETIEATVSATFLSPTDKAPYVRLAIRKMDTIKIFLLILWETKSLDNKKYVALSIKLEEIGKMLAQSVVFTECFSEHGIHGQFSFLPLFFNFSLASKKRSVSSLSVSALYYIPI